MSVKAILFKLVLFEMESDLTFALRALQWNIREWVKVKWVGREEVVVNSEQQKGQLE